MQIKNNSSYSSSPPATNIKSRNICQFHKSLIFLLLSGPLRCIQVPVSAGQVRLIMRLSACRAFLSARTNIPDLHTNRRHRNHCEGFSCGHRSAVVCGARSPVSSPEKPGSETQRLGVEGWRDKQKLVNKNIFPPLQWDFLTVYLGRTEGWAVQMSSKAPAGSTRSRCIKLQQNRRK